jgi:crotonobetainyl-CoA:carnitine CoA-transferase CaiB-like acyl-CoA transferase
VFDDPQIKARDAIVSVPDGELGPVRMQGVVPRFSETPGRVRAAGPAIGQHNEEVYGGLGLSAAEIAALRDRKVI